MHRRILFGVAAWLLGAATATAGSLLAVSLLGQGITGASGPLLTQDAVTRALARESSEAPAAAGPSAGRPSAPASPSGRPAATQAAASPSPAGATASPSPAQPAADSPAPAGTLLASRGGDVVASCLAAGAYLDSWSPSQGYDVGAVSRGPAGTARVRFDSGGTAVTMVVSCSAGVPSAVSYTHNADE